jgi:hypothetical protein
VLEGAELVEAPCVSDGGEYGFVWRLDGHVGMLTDCSRCWEGRGCQSMLIFDIQGRTP